MSQNKKTSSRHSGKKGKKASRQGIAVTSPFTSKVFQAKVERMDRLMMLAAKPTAPPPPGFKLVKEDGGTLEQVGREADNAWAGVKRIMSLLNVEVKHLYYQGSANCTQAGSVYDLGALITQGVGGSQRTGDSIKIKEIKLKWSMYAPVGADNFTLVIGRSKDGIPATMSDIFAFVSTGAAGLNFKTDTYEKADHWHWSETNVVVVGTSRAKINGSARVIINADLLYTNGSAVTASGSIWFAFISDATASFPVLTTAFDVTYVDN